MKLCEECKKMGCLHTLCKACFPKDAKPIKRDFTDTKASEWPVDNKGQYRQEIREHRREEGAIGNI